MADGAHYLLHAEQRNHLGGRAAPAAQDPFVAPQYRSEPEQRRRNEGKAFISQEQYACVSFVSDRPNGLRRLRSLARPRRCPIRWSAFGVDSAPTWPTSDDSGAQVDPPPLEPIFFILYLAPDKRHLAAHRVCKRARNHRPRSSRPRRRSRSSSAPARTAAPTLTADERVNRVLCRAATTEKQLFYATRASADRHHISRRRPIVPQLNSGADRSGAPSLSADWLPGLLHVDARRLSRLVSFASDVIGRCPRPVRAIKITSAYIGVRARVGCDADIRADVVLANRCAKLSRTEDLRGVFYLAVTWLGPPADHDGVSTPVRGLDSRHGRSEK